MTTSGLAARWLRTLFHSTASLQQQAGGALPNLPAAAPDRSDDGRIALTIGITGHRDITAADLPLYRQRIEDFFDSLEAAYPATPLRLLSALAEGADRLPVEVALTRGYQVHVPIPLPVADYEQDFPDSVAAFRQLMGRIPPENVFQMPALDDSAAAVGQSAEGLRDLHYAQAGAYIASHCHLLLALWDGVDTTLCGGTSEVVRYKLAGERPPALPVADALALPDTGPVVQLRTRRERDRQPLPAVACEPDPRDRRDASEGNGDSEGDADGAPAGMIDRGGVNGELIWHFPQERSEADFRYIYERIDAFNGDRAGDRAPEAAFSGMPAALRRQQRDVIAAFSRADALAVHYQRISNRVLSLMVTLGGAMALLYECYSHLSRPRLTLGAYLLAFILVCLVYGWQRRSGAHERHLDYRALAEGLRVQLFWSIAGVRLSVAGAYLRKQNDELQWIREALRPVKVTSECATAPANFLYEAWICDQVAYFSRSANRLRTTVRRAKIASLLLFAVGLVRTTLLFLTWDMLEAAHELHHWSIVLIGSAPVVGALIDAHSERMGNEARSKQHAILAGTFNRAAQAFRRLQARHPDQIAPLQPLLAELGREALIENGDWVLLRRERPMVLPKG